ncbi:dynein light intermediate chain-domain-containing protein [Truncatella angustata]|uniref:Dynein light intermediate chain-domain-containing protein n=1 Tax=Truncatella angustata TaxID=152316 RepID=A0A9P8RK98_9PEZI|nr:dynein light intermediate chain-domain-containing protein [Truncatella angustata]KAH6643404.1 dynein light intermediate chain-domain-containing protein [Truncatella angustata]
MTANTNRFSTYTSTSTGPEDEEKKKDMWSSMLDNVASAKRLPEKNMLVLGGSVESQREFLEALSSNEQRRNLDRSKDKIPPIANSYALGYTYYDVLDADQEDILARVSMYLLSTPSPAFTSLLKPLLTRQSIPNTLIVILLDWSQPWAWMRQLRDWILLMRTVISSLSLECKDVLEENLNAWKDRGRGGSALNLDGTAAVTSEGDMPLPVGQGEWDEPLGLPVCVVCQNAERMDYLEKSQSWKEEQFDLVLQYLRTTLLKHGASLIYTSPAKDTPLQSLIHASLGVHSLLKRAPLKHNVIDRDKIVVPPNWDSTSKIMVLRDGFDVDAVSNGWSIDIDQPFILPPKPVETNGAEEEVLDSAASTNGHTESILQDPEGSAVALYESQVQDSSLDALHLAQQKQDTTRLEVEAASAQDFLATLVPRIDTEKKVDEEQGKQFVQDTQGADEVISEHIGPVQFNMGGIQVDADDMVQRLKDRQAYSQTPEPPADAEEESGVNKPVDTERLAQFFGNLMNRKPGAGK